MIQSFKYRRAAAQGRVLGLLLAGRLAQQVDVKPQALIPMPLGTKRYLERGFNQSFELARVVGAHLDLPVCGAAVVRRRETQEQAGLQRKERRRNVRDAFAVTRLPAGHVAILDDVITTGSTADELAKALRRAGVRRVDLWAVAKTSGRIR